MHALCLYSHLRENWSFSNLHIYCQRITWPRQFKRNWINMFFESPFSSWKRSPDSHVTGPLPCVTDYFCPWKIHGGREEEGQTGRRERGGGKKRPARGRKGKRKCKVGEGGWEKMVMITWRRRKEERQEGAGERERLRKETRVYFLAVDGSG